MLTIWLTILHQSVAQTHVHAVPEDAEPLDPLEKERNGGDLDEESAEHHHADPDERRQHGADGVLARRRAEHQRNRTPRHARQHDVEHVERKVPEWHLETCVTAKHNYTFIDSRYKLLFNQKTNYMTRAGF